MADGAGTSAGGGSGSGGQTQVGNHPSDDDALSFVIRRVDDSMAACRVIHMGRGQLHFLGPDPKRLGGMGEQSLLAGSAVWSVAAGASGGVTLPFAARVFNLLSILQGLVSSTAWLGCDWQLDSPEWRGAVDSLHARFCVSMRATGQRVEDVERAVVASACKLLYPPHVIDVEEVGTGRTRALRAVRDECGDIRVRTPCLPLANVQRGKPTKGGSVSPTTLKKQGYLLCNLSRVRPRVTYGAHALVLWAYVGPPPDAKRYVCMHVCDNKRCINPKHLYWGTRSMNKRGLAGNVEAVAGAVGRGGAAERQLPGGAPLVWPADLE